MEASEDYFRKRVRFWNDAKSLIGWIGRVKYRSEDCKRAGYLFLVMRVRSYIFFQLDCSQQAGRIQMAWRNCVKLNLIEELEARRGGIKVSDVATILGVGDKHIYRMAARGQLPSFRVGGAVRFDPQEVAKWLRTKYSQENRS